MARSAGGPDVVAAGENIAQQRTERIAQRVQVGCLRSPGRSACPVSVIVRIWRPCVPAGRQLRLQLLRLDQAGTAVVILPIVHKGSTPARRSCRRRSP